MSKVFIYDSAKKLLVQKLEMEKPDESLFYEFNPVDPHDQEAMGFDMEGYKKACDKYQKHIASLPLYPCSFLPDEADGKEFIEGRDFKIRSYVCVNRKGDHPDLLTCVPGDENCNNYCNQNPAAGKMKDSPKIVAVPIQQEPGKPKGLVFGVNHREFMVAGNIRAASSVPDSVILTRKELEELFGYNIDDSLTLADYKKMNEKLLDRIRELKEQLESVLEAHYRNHPNME